MSKPHKHLTPEYIAEYMKKLAWLEKNPVPKIKISEEFESARKRSAAAFHNRLTTSQLL